MLGVGFVLLLSQAELVGLWLASKVANHTNVTGIADCFYHRSDHIGTGRVGLVLSGKQKNAVAHGVQRHSIFMTINNIFAADYADAADRCLLK